MKPFVAFLAFAAACGVPSHEALHTGPAAPPRDVPTWVDVRFLEPEVLAIRGAFTEWNCVLVGHRRFVVVSESFDMEPSVLGDVGSGLVILARSETDPVLEVLPVGVLGWVVHTPGEEGHEISLLPGRFRGNPALEFSGAVLHEIGHVLGLPDLLEGDSLMRKDHRRGLYVDAVTIAALGAMRGWNLHTCGAP